MLHAFYSFYYWIIMFRSLRSQLQFDLLEAAKYGSLHELQNALDQWADPRAPDPNTLTQTHPMTALHYAAYYGHADCVALLLPVSDPLALGAFGRTSLHFAADMGHVDCVSLLLQCSDPNLPDCYGYTSLILAARNGKVDCVQLLLPASNLTQTDVAGFTVLQSSARSEYSTCASEHSALCLQLIEAFLLAQNEQNDLDHHTPRTPLPIQNKPRPL